MKLLMRKIEFSEASNISIQLEENNQYSFLNKWEKTEGKGRIE